MAMRFEHEFTVPVPVEQAWPALLDVERVAPCLPGATLETVEGDSLTGRMKVKVGPITITYRGEAAFEDVDKDARTLTVRASGKESRGAGTAAATVLARLHPEGADTRVTVETSFTVTGRPAQFGRGVMAEVGAKLIDRFAANLSRLLEGGGAEPAMPVESAPESPAVPAGQAGPEGSAVPKGQEPSKPPASPESVAISKAPEDFGGEVLGEPGEYGEFFGQDGPHRHLSSVPPARETAEAEKARGRDIHPAGTSRTSRTPDEEALDLMEIAGLPLLKRVAPPITVLIGLVLTGWLIRWALRHRSDRDRPGDH